MFFGHYFLQFLFCLLRCFGVDPSETIGDLVHMAIDADGLDAKAKAQSQIGCLDAYSRKFHKRSLATRHLALISLKYDVGYFEDILGLSLKETRRIDGLLYLFLIEPNHFFGSIRKGE